MKVLRTCVLFIGLLTSGFGVLSASGQNTIEEAILQVKSIIDPDPIKQNELRAEEAKKIIMARIRTLNPDGKDDPALKNLNDELDKLRVRPGGIAEHEMMDWTWQNRAGRCDEQKSLMIRFLETNGVKTTTVTSGNHTFLLVNLADDADLDNPWTWGPNAIAPDTWVGKTLKPEDSWKEKWHFDDGKKFVGSNIPSTRHYLNVIENTTNPNAIDKDCKVKIGRGKDDIFLDYRKMLNNYFKIPEEYRKNLEFRPKVDIALEAGELELAEIHKKIDQMNKNDEHEVRSIHAWISDLDGRIGQISRCCEKAELFRKKINETFKLIPKLKTDAIIGISDEVPEDIVNNTGEVKVVQYFVFLLTNASYGLFIGSEDALKTSVRCSFTGGGRGCKPTDLVTYKKLLGPFAAQAEAQEALCQSITESRVYPLGIGLKGRWQGSNNWYGLWDVSISDCPKR